MLLALSLALLNAGNSRLARISTIAMTTNNSTKVNASFLFASGGTNQEINQIFASKNGVIPSKTGGVFTYHPDLCQQESRVFHDGTKTPACQGSKWFRR